ncbi:S8 family serine peptidase [Actinokineospora sp. NBRC 105648]|uniref:S8 family serine peptidase n=1 Tax=Actinokineospora sp. NBRC 105648 TaxID=3032206 RepID=UPI0024A0C862|nr:S8 family serine peptidase [Actinokineospora sp. NBRC 105648]GLZ42314.1 hypothetical protein Acsp05_59380 [Actinokineospora sp. NBRC 105648]
MRRDRARGLLPVLIAAALAVGVAVPADAAEGAVFGADRVDAIAGSYIVLVRDEVAARSAVAATADRLTGTYGGTVTVAWRHAVHGFAARMTATQARRLAADPAVASVEQDAVARIAGEQPNPPNWGLDRVDQRALPLDAKYGYGTTASNVTAYVIDTGVRVTHSTFEGRAVWGTNTLDTNNTDCHGHGTHVGGIIGGKDSGLAKGVKVVAVKVLGCSGSGSNSSVISGIDWVTRNAVKPAVANMSLTSSADPAMDTAVRNSIASGVTYALASANDNKDACNSSPARVAEGITANAVDKNDARASFSNFGPCTDIFAPGVGIVSSWKDNDNAVFSASGTSMAAPHVAGAAALWLGTHPADTPAQVGAGILAAATPDKVTNPGTGSPNRLLYVDPSTRPQQLTLPSPGDQTGTVGRPASARLTAVGGTGPFSWSATGLPAGVELAPSTTDTITATGTPTTAGPNNVAVTVTDAKGATAQASFTWTIAEAGGLTLANPGDQAGEVGVESGVKLVAGGGTRPHTWSATGLPAGITTGPDDNGVVVLSGVPTAAGTSTVVVTVRDSAGASASTTFRWVITDGGTCPPAQKVVNPGFESGTTGWASSPSVIGQTANGKPAHTGTWRAWLGGWGRAHTSTLSQTVAIPAGCSRYQLSIWLRVDTAEREAKAYDRLTVSAGAKTLATFSNLDAASGYRQLTYDLAEFAGQSVAVRFTGLEDSALQTSFALDDVTLTVG